MCVLLSNEKVKLSALRYVIEVGNKKERVYLRMNALLELKLLHPRKTMIYLQPSLITSLVKSFGLSLCVFDSMS